MKSTTHLLISVVCFMILLYQFTYNHTIINHPYMMFLIYGLFLLGGWNLGVGLAKLKNGK